MFKEGDIVRILTDVIPNTGMPVPSVKGQVLRIMSDEERRDCRIHPEDFLPYWVQHTNSDKWWYGAEHLELWGKFHALPEPDFTLCEIELAEKLIGHER